MVDGVLPGRRGTNAQDPANAARYHDALNPAHGGEIRELQQAVLCAAAARTHGPMVVHDSPGEPSDGDNANLESAAVLNLLDHEEPANGDGPMLVVLGALAFLVCTGGVWRWLPRASRYDPA